MTAAEQQVPLVPLAREPISFVVGGVPTPKGRPRARVVIIGGRPTAQFYTPAETRAAEQIFLTLAMPAKPKQPLTGPLRLDLLFVLPIPPSWPVRERARAATGARWPSDRGTPDRDNLLKLVQDALNGVFWHDDSQICAGETRMIYGTDPRTEVRITQLIEGEE